MDYPYYVIWTGSISLGDTPGTFMDSQYAGLLVQIPFTISFPAPPETVSTVTILLTTTEVEIFKDSNGSPLVHTVYLNWQPGTAFPPVAGIIDDSIIFEGKPEINRIDIPGTNFGSVVAGRHTLTIQVNPDTNAGLRDDFVLKRIEISENVGARIGW